MAFSQWANDFVKKLKYWDVKLIALAGLLIGIILVKLIPSILDINIWWFFIIAVLCLVRVYCVAFPKKGKV
jgi:hypothetical protein